MNNEIEAVFVGFGEINTPTAIIEKMCLKARKELEEKNIKIIVYKVLDDNPNGEVLEDTINEIEKKYFDVLIICIAGWIPSWAVITLTDKFPHKAMLLWGLAGTTENNILRSTACQAGTSALRKVFEDMKYRFKYVYNYPDTPSDMGKIVSFARAAKSINMLRDSKIGMMGFRDMKLYGTLYDGISLKQKIGVDVEFFEMLEIAQIMNNLDDKEILDIEDKVKREWIFKGRADDEILKKGIKLYLAVKKKVIENNYKGISLIDVDGVKKLMHFTPAITFMMLADYLNICTIPENDTLGSVTQLIVKYLTGQAAAYMEFYEFMKDRVLIGVPDYIPNEIVKGRTTVTVIKFGETGKGLLNISKVKTGKVTLCRLYNSGTDYLMHIFTGEAVEPRAWEEVGWEQPAPRLPGLEIILDGSVENFAQKVTSQHCIISYGDNTVLLDEFCKLLSIQTV